MRAGDAACTEGGAVRVYVHALGVRGLLVSFVLLQFGLQSITSSTLVG